MKSPSPDNSPPAAPPRRPALLKEILWIIVTTWALVSAIPIPVALMLGTTATGSLITIIGGIAIAFASFLFGAYYAAWLLAGAIPHIDQPAEPADCNGLTSHRGKDTMLNKIKEVSLSISQASVSAMGISAFWGMEMAITCRASPDNPTPAHIPWLTTTFVAIAIAVVTGAVAILIDRWETSPTE